MPLPPATRTLLVVQRAWPQQENPALPLLPADAPAVLAARVVSASAGPGDDPAALPGRVETAAAAIGLDLPGTAVLQGVCDHALRAGGGAEAVLRLVAADVGAATLVYAPLVPIAVDPGAPRS